MAKFASWTLTFKGSKKSRRAAWNPTTVLSPLPPRKTWKVVFGAEELKQKNRSRHDLAMRQRNLSMGRCQLRFFLDLMTSRILAMNLTLLSICLYNLTDKKPETLIASSSTPISRVALKTWLESSRNGTHTSSKWLRMMNKRTVRHVLFHNGEGSCFIGVTSVCLCTIIGLRDIKALTYIQRTQSCVNFAQDWLPSKIILLPTKHLK